MRNTTRLFTTMLMGSILALAGAVGAQQQQQAAPAEIDVSDQQLEAFVEAQDAIVEIQQDYSQRLQNADDPDRANQLQQEANQKMIDAVEETGLEVDSFNNIAMALQNDPELQQRLEEVR